MTDERVERARKRVRELRGFYVHIATYLSVIAGIAVINGIITPRRGER